MRPYNFNGQPQELTQPNGQIVWSAAYDAVGQIDEILADDVAQPLRMQGQYWDAELDLCYNRNRYYDPQIGAFISQDPLGLAAGENVYAYAPNVWGWVDPLGLSCKPSGLPAGRTFEDEIHRAVNPKYIDGAWDIHAGNIGASHRYSDVGRGALYAGTSKNAVLAELKHYSIDPKDVTIVKKKVKVDNVLDLTDSNVRSQLGIELSDITGNDYTMTQSIGDFARTRYSGMIVPSAREAGTSNLVLFQ